METPERSVWKAGGGEVGGILEWDGRHKESDLKVNRVSKGNYLQWPSTPGESEERTECFSEKRARRKLRKKTL